MVTGLKVKEKPVSIENVHNFFFTKTWVWSTVFLLLRSSRWSTAIESYFWLVTRDFLILRIASSDISSTIVVLVGQQLFTAQGFSYFDPLDGPILLRVIFWQLICHFLLLRFSCSDIYSMKSVHIRSYSGPHFPAFELNTERYFVSLRIESKSGKMRTRITPNTDNFCALIFSTIVVLVGQQVFTAQKERKKERKRSVILVVWFHMFQGVRKPRVHEISMDQVFNN